jgi:lsr operon transcriptional repressor
MQSARETDANLGLLGKAARLHYEYGLTHQEIADILRISRIKVTRLLAQAREQGVVEIVIRSDASPYAELEAALATAFALDEALVVPGFDAEDRLRAAHAQGAASYLQRILHDGMVVAIGQGRTIAMLGASISSPRPTQAFFVSLAGGLSRSASTVNPYESTERLSQLFGGRAEHLHAPAVVGSADVAVALRSDPGISGTLKRAAGADTAFVGVGSISGSVHLRDSGAITAQELSSLRAAGAIGDIAGRFFDPDGEPVDHPLNERLIGLTLAEFAGIPLRVVAAGGPDKDEPLLVALQHGMISVLVTDARTTERLLARAGGA